MTGGQGAKETRRQEHKRRRQTGSYIFAFCCLLVFAACVRAPQPASTPSSTVLPPVVAPTLIPSATVPIPSPQPSSTLRPTLGPSPIGPNTPLSTLRSPLSTSSPIGPVPTLARLPTAVPFTGTPVAPRSTLHPPLIPASAPRVYETTVTIPTYGYLQALEPSAKDAPIYPYPYLNWDKVGPPAPKSYRAIILENSYTQVTILPELGGRIWRMVDRTTGRTVTYQNPVVKPTHWGYRGWWLAAGGIEWCLPVEEHGLNEYRPWNASLGGASVTVSDHEDRTGLDVAVTISLDAAHSYVTIQPRVTNSTGSSQQMQLWVNAMLALNGNRATDATRFVLPASQVTIHSTGDDSLPAPGSRLNWPIVRGRDLSRYVNWQGYLGFFASPVASGDFVGAYDTSSDQGVVRVFPAGIARGVKLFGGKGIDPATWTNDGSTYFELWGGLLPTFSDYTTIQPGQTFGWTERWYPVSGLGQGFDTANAAAALRLASQADGAAVSVVTSANLDGQVKLWQNNRVVATWPVAVGPGRAFNGQWSGDGSQGTVGVQLLDSTGKSVGQAGSVP